MKMRQMSNFAIDQAAITSLQPIYLLMGWFGLGCVLSLTSKKAKTKIAKTKTDQTGW